MGMERISLYAGLMPYLSNWLCGRRNLNIAAPFYLFFFFFFFFKILFLKKAKDTWRKKDKGRFCKNSFEIQWLYAQDNSFVAFKCHGPALHMPDYLPSLSHNSPPVLLPEMLSSLTLVVPITPATSFGYLPLNFMNCSGDCFSVWQTQVWAQKCNIAKWQAGSRLFQLA